MMMELKKQKIKPFLKWAGGKSQLLEQFQVFYPRELKENKILNYYEPFLGSGAVFFQIAQQYKIKQAFLSDVNNDLVITYLAVQRDVNLLIKELQKHQQNYSGLDKSSQAAYFYEQRLQYNLELDDFDYNTYSKRFVQRAAKLIFLNRTCFNGLYRVNSKGEFNSPVGKYKNPLICDEVKLLSASKLLRYALIQRSNFGEIVNSVKPESFIYFDPPYRPISKTSVFNSYSNNIFSDNEQIRLSEIFTTLHHKGTKLMLSNSDPKNVDASDNFFDDLYKEYHIYRIPARRLINSNATKRGTINEIVVTNYPVDSI